MFNFLHVVEKQGVKVSLACLFFFLSAFVFFPIISGFSLNNITLTQQNLVCSTLNFTFVDCYEFWKVLNNTNTTYYCNYSNYTLTSTINCSNITVCKNCSDTDLLLKIDDYKLRGFEPVFEAGIITNWRKIENLSCPLPDCNKECEALVLAVRSQYNSTSYVVEDESNNKYYIIFSILFILAIISFYLYNKFKHKFVQQLPVSRLSLDFPKPSNSEEGRDRDGF